jgi:hypothetical protein
LVGDHDALRPSSDDAAGVLEPATIEVTHSQVGVESVAHLYVEGWNVATKLHRCPTMWVKIDAHPCWRVQKALDEQGIVYEVVKRPARRSHCDALES